MAERLPRAGSLAGPAPADALRARIDDLRARGAPAFDAVAWRVIEAMLRRLAGFDGAARTALVRKIERRLATFRERLERAGGDVGPTPSAVATCLPRAADAYPAASAGADPLASNGIPGQPQAWTGQAQSARGMLAELLAHIGRQAGDPSGADDVAAAGAVVAPATELKSLRYFRSTWSRLSLEQQLARALAQAPDNAGPLNSHFLVLQALIRMRDIAPQYLEGFIAHVDALFWLERADPGRGAVGRGAAPKVGARKGEARARSGRTRRQSRGAEG